MKFDKELLIKHHFWILAGTFLLFWLVSLLIVQFSTASAVVTAADEYKKSTEVLTPFATNAVNTTTYLPPWNFYEKLYRDHKDIIWANAWEKQKSLFTWPGEFRDYWEQAASFKDWIDGFADQETRSNRLSSFVKLYRSQFNRLMGSVYPVEFKNGEAGFDEMMVPRLAGGGGGSRSAKGGFGPPGGLAGPPGLEGGGLPTKQGGAAAPMGQSVKTFFSERPTLEEAWLAQEDYWVKKEILDVISRTLDSEAVFTKVNAGDKTAPGATTEPKKEDSGNPDLVVDYLGWNRSWEIHLLITKDKDDRYFVSPASTIKNIDPSRRYLAVGNPKTKQPMRFHIVQRVPNNKDSIDSKIEVNLEPLAPDSPPKAFGDQVARRALDNFDPNLPFTLMQEFEWANSPIRRIDEIRLGAQSHRTSYKTLNANNNFHDPEDSPAPAPAKAAPAPTGGGKTSAGGKSSPGKPGLASRGADAGADRPLTSFNSLERARYLQVNGQCRHVPIGLVVVMDQDHIHELLAELTNSRLRFQITQVEFHHVSGIQSLNAQQLTQEKPVEKTPQLGRFGGTGPGGPATSNGPVTSPTDTSDGSLVEVCIYGIAALYERYSPPGIGRPANPTPGAGGRGGPAGPAAGGPGGQPGKGGPGGPPPAGGTPPAGGAPKDKPN